MGEKIEPYHNVTDFRRLQKTEDVVVMTFYLEIITRLLWLTRANAGAPAAAVPAPAPPVMPAPTPALTAARPRRHFSCLHFS